MPMAAVDSGRRRIMDWPSKTRCQPVIGYNEQPTPSDPRRLAVSLAGLYVVAEYA